MLIKELIGFESKLKAVVNLKSGNRSCEITLFFERKPFYFGENNKKTEKMA